MTSPTVDVEPACPGDETPGTSVLTGTSGERLPAAATHPRTDLRVERRPFAAFDVATWDDLAARSPWTTPFSRWAFHRAWWDGYGPTAHDQTLAVIDPAAPPGAPPVGIVPLMHRHEVEASDLQTHTRMRADPDEPLTSVSPHAKAVFFGATYHADYATVLAAPDVLAAVAEAVVDHLAAAPDPSDPHPLPWDVVDLRRIRCGDPVAEAFARAFGRREIAEGWTLNVEREDVCPVATLPERGGMEGFLAGLDKKERHEIRRKVQRAEAAGPVRLDESVEPLADLEAFIDLHQRRWGADGLFPDTVGGAQSRVFFHRLFELFGPADALRLSFLSVAGRRVAAGIHLEDGDAIYYYNAGVDPAARELSPGMLLIAGYVERAIRDGRRRFDFLRGNEPYKYGWGAVDEPIQRLLVRRTGS